MFNLKSQENEKEVFFSSSFASFGNWLKSNECKDLLDIVNKYLSLIKLKTRSQL